MIERGYVMAEIILNPFFIIAIIASIVIILLLIVINLLGKVKKLQQETNFETLAGKIDFQEQNSARIEMGLKNEIAANRMEMSISLKQFEDSLLKRIGENMSMEKQQYDSFTIRIERIRNSNDEKLGQVIDKIDEKLEKIRIDNSQKIERMRETVDEKLSSTLETRLSESFKSVSANLEQVQKGLGEMRSLAAGVGDLKKVLSNVKTKGVLGEYQLQGILEMILAPEQYGKNVKTHPEKGGYVEFAVKLPGGSKKNADIWLPIDSKFPTEEYIKLSDAYEIGDVDEIGASRKRLENLIKRYAKDIRDKYVHPPETTPFAVMFLPFEGLYAEVLRTPGIFEEIQREFRITITGPTTLSAFLNSLRMGFNTLAIEEHSNEIWEILSSIQQEFGKFGDILQKTRKKLQEASNSIDSAETRTRVIESKLKRVGEIDRPYNEVLRDESKEELDQ